MTDYNWNWKMSFRLLATDKRANIIISFNWHEVLSHQHFIIFASSNHICDTFLFLFPILCEYIQLFLVQNGQIWTTVKKKNGCILYSTKRFIEWSDTLSILFFRLLDNQNKSVYDGSHLNSNYHQSWKLFGMDNMQKSK